MTAIAFLATAIEGESLTLWMIRLALLFYVVAVSLLLILRNPRFPKSARNAWTIACGLYVVHVLFAFHFYHDWSHTKAYEHTAEKTLSTVGWNWGGGIYFNYLFTLLWTSDVLLWWLRPDKYPKRKAFLHLATHAFIAFIAFNATVVFASGFVRWFGIVATLWLASICLWRYRLGDFKLNPTPACPEEHQPFD